MQRATNLTLGGKFLAIVAVIIWLETLSVPAGAQAGNNAICTSTGQTQCGPTAPSPAFIDASVFGRNNTDFCALLYNILGGISISYPATGTVVDARGLPGNTGTSMVCANGASPWFNGSNFANVPSTILLPAGTITIPSTWVLPGGTKLIGEGSEIPALPIPISVSGSTMIQACTTAIPGCSTTSNFSGTMIDFGSACPGAQCTGAVKGVSLEKVVLNGNGLNAVNGIQNGEAQELSYVDHVALLQILGLGLNVTGSAQNSGPYSNITFDTGNFSPNTSTSCAQIFSVGGGWPILTSCFSTLGWGF